MTDDRQLLEAAARAAGLEIVRWSDGGDPLVYFDQLRPWNPLRNLATARNLRHRLQLTTRRDHLFAYAGRGDTLMTEDFSKGKLAATRRAIVRAAASLGADTEQGT